MKFIIFKKKTFAILIIASFIGIGISPAFAVEIKQSIVKNQYEESSCCNKISDADIAKVEGLLNNVIIYSKILMVLSRNNPEIKGEIEDLSKEFSKLKVTLGGLSEEDFPIICAIFGMLWDVLWPLSNYFEDLWKAEDENPLVEEIKNFIGLIGILLLFWPLYIVGYIGFQFQCDWAPEYYPYLNMQ